MRKIKQKKVNVTQFVEEIKDLTRQLSSPLREKSMRAWFLNGTSLKGLNKAEITNPTRGFEELIQRARKMEKKISRKKGSSSSLETSSLEESSDLEGEPAKKKRRDWHAELRMIRNKVEELTGSRANMPKKGEKWCVPCRVDTHSTTECVKCDYCERRGHAWEECPIRLTVPAFAINQARQGESKGSDTSY